MNSILRRVEDVLPPITDICYYSRDQINNHSMGMVDDVIKDSIKNIKSLQYLGIRKMTPDETYESLLSTNNVMDVDITKSTYYKTVLEFKTLSDEIIKIKLALPYLDKYGRLLGSDVAYNIKPIFTDSVISPHASGVFIKLLITKTNASSIPMMCNINGVLESLSVIYLDMNRRVVGDNTSKQYRVVTPISFYVLSKYGLVATMKMVTNANFRVVKKYDYVHDGKGIYYTHNDSKLGFVIDIEDRLDIIDNIIASVFYILINSDNRENELYRNITEDRVEDDLYFWLILFGRFFYKGSLTYDKSTMEIKTHLDRVANYLDPISRADLKSIMVVEDFTDLCLNLLGVFNTLILKHKDINANIEQHKKLKVLYYILNGVIIAINRAFSEIFKRESARAHQLSTKELEKILGDNITERLIYRVVKSTKKNLCINLNNGCTDNLLDSLLISDEQNRGDGVFVNSKSTFPAVLRNITPLQFIVGSMHDIGKKAPTPLLKLNPFIEVDNNGQFLIDPILSREAKTTYGRMRAITDYVNHQLDEDDIDDMDLDD